VESAGGYIGHVGLSHVVGLDLLQNLGIEPHLTVCAILVAAGVNAEDAELAQGETQAKSGKNGYGEYKY
jgi:hypothetical protein